MEKRFDEMNLIELADYRFKKAEQLEQLKNHLRFQFRLISVRLFVLALIVAYSAGSK